MCGIAAGPTPHHPEGFIQRACMHTHAGCARTYPRNPASRPQVFEMQTEEQWQEDVGSYYNPLEQQPKEVACMLFQGVLRSLPFGGCEHKLPRPGLPGMQSIAGARMTSVGWVGCVG